MPTFDYQCEACGHTDECFIRNPTDESKVVVCPKCGVERFVRQIGAGGGCIFKGEGFYVNDYKKKENK